MEEEDQIRDKKQVICVFYTFEINLFSQQLKFNPHSFVSPDKSKILKVKIAK